MTKDAPMVDEITDFEVLEVALRELSIEKGLFTAETIGDTPSSPREWGRHQHRA